MSARVAMTWTEAKATAERLGFFTNRVGSAALLYTGRLPRHYKATELTGYGTLVAGDGCVVVVIPLKARRTRSSQQILPAACSVSARRAETTVVRLKPLCPRRLAEADAADAQVAELCNVIVLEKRRRFQSGKRPC